jgi:hypothetical protein
MSRPFSLASLGLALLLGTSAPGGADEAPPAPPVAAATEEARKAAIDEIRRDLKRWAASPRIEEVKPNVLKALQSLETIGGEATAKVALEAVAMNEPEVRDRAFAVVEKERPKDLVKTLAALPDDRRFKRDFDLHKRVAHALAVIADVSAIEPLTQFLLSDDAAVVAAAADALGTFASAPHKHRVEPVKRMIDLYEGTWNKKESIRPEDRVAAKQAADDWEVFGKSLRASLQALTRQTITRPREWRDWWNDHKKEDSW